MAVSEKSLQNLKPIKSYKDCKSDAEKERIKAITSKGGKVLQETVKKAKTWNDVCNQALLTKVDKEKATKYLGDDVDLLVFDDDGLVTMQEVLTVRAMQIASDGNVKSLEFIRDTSGQRPIDRSAVDISADIMTAADRALIENINARLNAADP
jgi:hypothetical protein